MFRKNDGQLNFFDQEIFSKMIPQDHPLVKIKNNVDLSFVDQEVACHYSPDTGRPYIPPPVRHEAGCPCSGQEHPCAGAGGQSTAA